MDKDKLIELAKRAGFNWPEVSITTIEERLERFAQLVRDYGRAELLAGSGEPVGYKHAYEKLQELKSTAQLRDGELIEIGRIK
jgi:hypothetical protein